MENQEIPDNLFENEPEEVTIPSQIEQLIFQHAPKIIGLVEKHLNNNKEEKLAQIQFQQLQLELRQKELEIQKMNAEKNHEISLVHAENGKNQARLNYKTALVNLAFKGFAYGSILLVVYNLAVLEKMNDVLWSVLTVTAFSVFGIDVKNLLNAKNQRRDND